jgi:hypothetical protein
VTTGLYFTDAEVDELCAGLTQDAAKARFLRRIGLRVDRKPNGRPLAWRPEVQQATGTVQNPASESRGINVVGLDQWAAERGTKGRRSGAKA